MTLAMEAWRFQLVRLPPFNYRGGGGGGGGLDSAGIIFK